ncbi:MAG: sigma-70 family RNA polymerase sigma factor [Planctomycetes bacterium]|nr:sigma-70 family RNA polymerase sigma factor [Phycisphaerae bacterium]NBB94516.1 sigma-70 family RNA polymerase sigma factor [Planctomycetota bacterium]
MTTTKSKSKSKTTHRPVEKNGVEYIYYPEFNLPQTEEHLWGSQRDEIDVAEYHLLPQVEDGTAPPTAQRTTLSAPEERVLFMRYNYAKFRHAQALGRKTGRRSQRRQRDIRRWQRRADRTRETIVHANLPLVPSMARRSNIPGVEFTELISEGYMAVLRCVEKFDVSRGYKFSTYACRSILSCFYRLASKSQTYRKHVPCQFEIEMEQSDFPERRHDDQRETAVDTVRRVLKHNLGDLSDAESRVIQRRFPIVGHEKRHTLAEVGREVGLSNERVRQIERQGLAKIREAVNDDLAA